MESLESKEAIRQRLLSLRQRLDPAQIHSWSQDIFQNLQSLLQTAKVIGLYAPVRGEVETQAVFELARSRRAVTAYPRVEAEGLTFYEATPSDLSPGRWGLPEPAAVPQKAIALEEIDVLIVPGVAFARDGHRIGFGKGYYDRLLGAEAFHGEAIGLAYEFQLLKSFPGEASDRPCHWVVTEKRVVAVGKREPRGVD